MLYFTHKLIEEVKAKDLARSLIILTDWVDGKASSEKGSKVKKNLQLNLGETHTTLSKEIIEIIKNDDLISNTFFPSKI